MGAAVAVSGMRKGGGRRGGKKQDEEVAIVTCPGFPGYCSESYVGNTCTVVCARGRNNVPQCQADGTWTDIPRCIEHDPGIEEQKTDFCPGVPGYCSLDLPGGLCTFECPIGPSIRSTCSPDGTWEPYPTCQDDPRETQDGCNPCPGPNGGPRNRTAEAGGSGGGSSPRNGGSKKGPGSNNIPGAGGRKQAGGSVPGSRKGSSQRPRTPPRKSGAGGSRKQGGGGRKQGGGSRKQGGGGGGETSCPGEELQACIDVCPGFNARVFGACVAGCAKRCAK